MIERMIGSGRTFKDSMELSIGSSSNIGARAVLAVKSIEEKLGSHYPDDPTRWEDKKHLGLLVAQLDTQGIPYVGIHLPPVPAESRSLVRVRESFGLLAQYIRNHGLDERCSCIGGGTYQELAMASAMFGFIVIPDHIFSEQEQKDFRKSILMYKRAGLLKRDVGPLRMMLQLMDPFMQRFYHPTVASQAQV